MSSCDLVAERLAIGEPLAELGEHAGDCEHCQRLVELTGQLAATRHALDPGLGFSSRVTAGAQHRIGMRRRRRIGTGVAGVVAASMLGFFVLTRAPEPAPVAAVQPQPQPPTDDEVAEPVPAAEIEALVRMADTHRSRRLSAHWTRIQRPLAPYRALVEHAAITRKGGTP